MKSWFYPLIASAVIVVSARAEAQTPYPVGDIQERRPKVGCRFPATVSNLKLMMDGKDLTAQSARNLQMIEWVPNADIAPGQHECWAFGRNILGARVEKRWSFQIKENRKIQTSPGEGTSVSNPRPEIQATFQRNLRSARVRLDGQDVTSRVMIRDKSFVVVPGNDLSPGQHNVQSTVNFDNGQTRDHNWSFRVEGSSGPVTGGSNLFSAQTPPAGSRIQNRRPNVSVDFPANLQDVRMDIDNVDFSNQTTRMANRLVLSPSYDFDFGTHRVRVQGRLPNGQRIQTNWSFDIDANGSQGSSGANFTLQSPYPGEAVGANFSARGQASPYARIRVEVSPINDQRIYTYEGSADQQGNYSVPCGISWSNPGNRLRVRVVLVGSQSDAHQVEVVRR